MADSDDPPESPYVKIAAAVGGSAAGVFFISAVFGRGELWPAAVAVIALSAMGVGIVFFIHKNH